MGLIRVKISGVVEGKHTLRLQIILQQQET